MGKIRIENFLIPIQTESKHFVPPPHKSRNFSAPPPSPPPVWIGKLIAIKQVCVAGKVRY
jgi:hypothetical protein